MTEDGDISTTGTFYVTVAKEPTAIREGFIKRSGQIGEKGAFQFRIYRFISHFFLLKTLYGAHMSNEKKSPFLGGDGGLPLVGNFLLLFLMNPLSIECKSETTQQMDRCEDRVTHKYFKICHFLPSETKSYFRSLSLMEVEPLIR